MAHVLAIVRSGETRTLTSAPYSLMTYVPRNIGEAADEVEEQITIEVSRTSITDLQTDIQRLERLFSHADEYNQLQYGTKSWRVRLKFQPDGYADAYYADIVRGRIEIATPTNWLNAPWATKKMRLNLIITRKNYWEAASDGGITITNPNGTGDGTTGLRIDNCNDAGGSPARCNYVDIASTIVGGTLPAPLYFTLLTNKNDAKLVNKVWVGMYREANTGLANSGWSLELDDISEGTKTADAACSGAYYRALTWSATVETKIATLTFTGAQWALFSRQIWRLLLRLQAVHGYSDLWLKARLKMGSIVLDETPWVLTGAADQIMDLGMMKITPMYISTGAERPVSIEIYAKKTSAAAYALNADYLTFLPATFGCAVYQIGSGVPYYLQLVDDPYNDRLYSGDSTGYGVDVTRLGGTLFVRPSTAHKLVFHVQCTDGTAEIDRNSLIYLRYYQRRIML